MTDWNFSSRESFVLMDLDVSVLGVLRPGGGCIFTFFEVYVSVGSNIEFVYF